MFHGNLGEATLGGVSLPIGEIIGQSYLNSMGLLLVALIGAAGFGLYFGALAALIRFRRLVLPLLTITILGVSTPSFVAALILQLGELKYVQVFGRRLVSMGGFGWDYKTHASARARTHGAARLPISHGQPSSRCAG